MKMPNFETIESKESECCKVLKDPEIGFFKRLWNVITFKRNSVDWNDVLQPQADEAQFGKYQFLAKIGKGTYGKIYKACRKADNSLVAIKKVDCFGNSALEIELLQQLRHSCIIPIHDAFIYKKFHYMVLEISDSDLDTYRKTHSMDYKIVCTISKDVLRGISFMHALRIIHFDIKPKNILCFNNSFKICDLGSASRLPARSGPKGTPLFMAPEALRNNWESKALTVKYDVYSFGILLMQLLGYNMPYDIKKSFTNKEFFEHFCSPDFQSPRLMVTCTDWHCRFENIINGSLQVDPLERSSAADLIDMF